MSWGLGCDSGKIPFLSWDKHHQTSFPSTIGVFISNKHEISAVVDHDVSLWTNQHHPTDWLHVAGTLQSPAAMCGAAIRSRIQFESNVQVGCHYFHSDLLLIYNLQDFPLLLVIIFLTFPQQQFMAPETLQPGAIGAELSRTTGASTNAPPGQAKQQRRYQWVHRDTAIVATKSTTPEVDVTTVCKTGSSTNKKQHLLGCESIQINVDNGQQAI